LTMKIVQSESDHFIFDPSPFLLPFFLILLHLTSQTPLEPSLHP